MSDFIKDFKRLTSGFFESIELEESPGLPSVMPPAVYLGGQADLTPLRNKAREAADALAEAIRASDQGRVDDCLEAFRRAKSCIDAALGGQMGPNAGVAIVSPIRP